MVFGMQLYLYDLCPIYRECVNAHYRVLRTKLICSAINYASCEFFKRCVRIPNNQGKAYIILDVDDNVEKCIEDVIKNYVKG